MVATNVSTGPDFATALTSGQDLHLAAGDHWVNGLIKAGLNGVRVTGEPGTRVISTSVSRLIQLSNSRDVTFEGITFEAAGDTPSDDMYGLIYTLGATLRNIRFIGCEFIAHGRNLNGAKLVADGATQENAIDGVKFEDCEFHVGRMGVEIQHHPKGETGIRVRDVSVERSTFDECGHVSTGIDLSFSGPLVGAASRGNRFRGSIYAALEFAGPHTSPLATDNEFVGLGSKAQTLSITNKQDARDTVYAVLERNRSIGRSGAGAYLWNLVDARLVNNQFMTNSPVTFRDCNRMLSTGDVYDTAGVYAFITEGAGAVKECAQNVWRDARLTTAAGSGNYAVARFLGERCHHNRVDGGTFSKGPGGKWFDEIQGAHDNMAVNPVYV